MRARLSLVLLTATVPLAGAAHAQTEAGSCAPPRASAAYTAHVMRALAAGRDVWGERLLAAPSYDAVRRQLAPLLYARAAGDRPLTDSGVYYLPFAQGTSAVMLHVADGSEIAAGRADGRKLTVLVGGERYGSCLARLTPARLADGYLPILETAYRGYTQESFAARVSGKLTSFVRVTGPGPARFRSGTATLSATTPAYVAWSGGRPRLVDETAYDMERQSVVDYWNRRLATGATIEVPEPRVENALRALEIQNLVLGGRYSVGNQYEEFSFPETIDVAQVMAELGFGDVARSILAAALPRRAPYPTWTMGEKLLAHAEYFRLYGDRAYIARVLPTLARYVGALATRALRPERYSSDIPDLVLGLHSQSVAWAGLRAMAPVFTATGHAAVGARAQRTAARIAVGLRRAVRASERRLPDGSLFLPVRLLDNEPAYRSVVESRSGSYWNLVAPYALASGFFPPHGREANGALRYLLRHGSRLLGLVRAGAYALYGRDAPFPVSGTDEVYGINVARFLADNGQADQLVLSLYGELGGAMTPDTFVSGEGATLAPLHGVRYRAMYLPPNAASNAAFLATLRLMLVHETPTGLELAASTPRSWLAPGKTISVQTVPTSFGPVSFTLAAAAGSVHVTLDAPPARTLVLHLRLPHGNRRVDLSGRSGHLEFDVSTS